MNAAISSVDRDQDRLRITEVFLSLQGESTLAGIPTVFVRLTGCPLRCSYCDTAYAFSGGEWWSMAELINKVADYGVPHVTVTGGEPLAQKLCLPLLSSLCDRGWVVSLETGGAHDISGVDPRVIRIVDIKTPGSGESRRNLRANLGVLNARDQLKFVICDRADYDWACAFLARQALPKELVVLFSPVVPAMDPTQLADWIIEDRLAVRLQMQLHKLLWGGRPGT